MLTGHRKSFNPAGGEMRRVFLVETFRLHAIGKTDKRHRPVLEVGENERRGVHVVPDHFAFGKLRFREKNFVEIRKLNLGGAWRGT